MRTALKLRGLASRALPGLVLLASLLLGQAFHEWHHLQDHDCAGEAHCVCSILHTSTLVASETAAPLPVSSVGPTPVVRPAAPLPVVVPTAAIPRAPPAA